MADKKISALTGASTPLAGTEVLPIVQSGATVKVATNDLTVKNVRSNATTGILQVAGPGTAATRVMTTPDANFTVARIDAAQSFTGDQTLSTGNIVQGTAAKGVNFTANTPAAGMTSQLLNWYEEGTFTPVVQGSSSAGTANYSAQNGRYTKIGNKVFFEVYVNYSSGNGTGNLRVGGFPFTSAATGVYGAISIGEFANIALTALNVPAAEFSSGGTYVEFYQNVVGGGAPTAIPYDAAGYMIFGGFYTTVA
jgi:hypothetical protein